MFAELIEAIAKILFIFGVNMGFFAPILGWVERKQSAVMQDRIGANRADILELISVLFSVHTPVTQEFLPSTTTIGSCTKPLKVPMKNHLEIGRASCGKEGRSRWSPD